MLSKIDKHHVDCDIKPLTPTEWESSGTAGAGSYPTLHELDASEIPTKPTAPTIDDGTTPVTNNTELQAMNGSGSYILTYDPDLTGVTWTPITGFSGTLDGDGHTISNLSIDAAASDDQGLFGVVLDGFKCKDLSFEDCTVVADDHVGILFSRAHSLPGSATTLISNVNFTNCEISGDQKLGILGGWLYQQTASEIYNCSAINCTINVTTSGGTYVYCGGLIGRVDMINGATGATSDCLFTDCFAENITINNTTKNFQLWVGGLIGHINGQAYHDETYTGTYGIRCHSCYATGTISNASLVNVGGFVGVADGKAAFTSCYSNVDITQSQTNTSYNSANMGGFVGNSGYENEYTNCYSEGDISVTSSIASLRIGGFVGQCDVGDDLLYFSTETHFLRCYSTGTITMGADTSTYTRIGGFASEIIYDRYEDHDVLNTIERCWSESDISFTGTVSGATAVGAFVGRAYCGALNGSTYQRFGILDCYAWGTIDSTNEPAAGVAISGFLGEIAMTASSQRLTINNCYSAQTESKFGSGYTDELVYTSANTGGIIAENNSGDLVITNTFWDTETSGITTTPEEGAVGQETSWMMEPDNYEDAGWDLDTIWELLIVSATNYVQQEADGQVDSIAVMPGMPDSGEDEVWVAVLRDIGGVSTRFIEVMQPRKFATQSDCYFVDCGVQYDGDATTTITGLDHLEGETVSILGDGADYGDMVVSDGSVTLPIAVSKASVGLPFRYKLKPMRLDTSDRRGASHGMIKKIGRLFISFIKTLMAKQGIAERLYDIDWRTEENYDSPPELFTGERTVDNFDGGYSADDPILITGERPFPCTVRSIVVDTDTTD